MGKHSKSQIEAMKKLGLSEQEIAELVASDDAIDKGAKMEFDLTKEQEKIAKQYIKTGQHTTKKAPTVYKLDNTEGKRSRKENATKSGIIAEIVKFLQENSEFAFENVEILNKERQIAFAVGENSFEITLVQKRKPKK